jgi:hypothetical protein
MIDLHCARDPAGGSAHHSDLPPSRDVAAAGTEHLLTASSRA